MPKDKEFSLLMRKTVRRSDIFFKINDRLPFETKDRLPSLAACVVFHDRLLRLHGRVQAVCGNRNVYDTMLFYTCNN